MRCIRQCRPRTAERLDSFLVQRRNIARILGLGSLTGVFGEASVGTSPLPWLIELVYYPNQGRVFVGFCSTGIGYGKTSRSLDYTLAPYLLGR